MNKYELTFPQKNIWMVENFYESQLVNIISGSFCINEGFDIRLAEKMVNKFVELNEGMRLRIELENNIPMQYVVPFVPFNTDKKNIQNMSNEEIEQFKDEYISKPINLIGNSLFSYLLLDKGNGAGEVFIKLHHIIGDAWTISKMGTAFSNMYEALLKDEEYIETSPGYTDFILAEQDYLNSERYVNDNEFWKEYLKLATSPVGLKDSGIIKDTKAKRYSIVLEENYQLMLDEYCKENRVSPYTVFLSALAIYIERIVAKDDFIIGTPVLNRSNFKEKNMAGMFISTMPVRFKIDENESFLELVKKVGTESLTLFRHQKYPYLKIAESYKDETKVTDNMYKLMLSYQNARASVAVPGKYELKWRFSGHIQDELEIHISDLNATGNLEIHFDYLTSLFEDIEIQYLAKRILAIIQDGIKNNSRIESINIMSDEEKNKILNDFNNTARPYPKDKTVIELFEEQAKFNLYKTALLFEETKMSYGELNSRANKLAGLLIEKGVKENDAVAIIVDKSYELIIAILAVLKVGAYYLPIEVSYTHEKKEYMINDACVKVAILDHVDDFNNVEEINITNIEFNYLEEKTITRSDSYTEESPVCILYTSGTTGNPKGALITNKNIVKLVKNPDYMELKSNDTIIQAASTSFDVSLFEFWGSLLNGGTCALITKANLLDFEYLNSYIKHKNVTIAWITAALFNQIIDGKIEVFESLHTVLSGGDVMSLKHVNKLRSVYPHLTIINCYGPTECVTFTNTYKIESIETKRVPLGRAISNTYGYVVDKKFRLLPIYTEGEYVIGGDSVALKYINKPKLTKEKFVSDEITNKGRMYKTGDVVRMLDKGFIDFVGRRDNQVKIRGYRIELDEITNRVLKLDNVKDAVTVIAEKSGVKHINLYYIGINNITDEAVISYLKETLPIYMVPTGIMKLDKMPLNQNGKVDRKNLPEIVIKHRQEKMNKTQKIIFDIIKEELQIEPTLDDNLFDVGLDSLSVIRVVNCISSKINTNITTRDVMKLATIHDIAEHIINENKKLSKEQDDIFETGDVNIISAQNSIFMEYMKDTETTLYNIPFELSLKNSLNIEKLVRSLKQVINNHPSFFTKFVVTNSKISEDIEVRDYKIEVNNISKEEYENEKNKFVKPFDLLDDLLFRIKVYILEDTINILFDFHHAIFDGHSLQLFLNELSEAYNEKELDKEISTYLDYVKEYNVLDEDINYFIDMFKEELQVTDMPYDRPRTKYMDREGNKVKFEISNELYIRLKEYISKNNFTINSLMQSVYVITLAKYTYSNDVTIGISDSNRVSAKYINTVGMFVKTLPYREVIDWKKQIVDYIRDTQKKIIDVYAHNTCSYEELLKHIKLNRIQNRTPLFDTLFVCQNKVNNIEIGNNEAHINEIKRSNAKFDMTFEVVPGDDMYITVEYRTSLYNEDTIKRFISNYLNVLNYILDNENSTLYDIEMISKEEKDIILNKFNNTKTDYPRNKAIHILFEEAVEKFKEKTAVVFEDKSFTYDELNKRANRLARYLLTKDVKKGEAIGIMIDKSIEYMIAVLGVLKAGLSYMPIAMDIPEERLKFLISNADVTQVITTNEFDRELQNVSKIYIDYIDTKNDYQNIVDDSNLDINIFGSDKAYILYTSGTTGVPKGILVPHIGITRLLLNTNLVNYTDKDIMLVSGSTTFDTSGFEIWGAMFYGMTLHLMRKKDILTPKYYGDYLEKNRITTTLIPTPIFNQLAEYNVNMFKNLDTLYVGGDVLQPKYSNLIIHNCPNVKLINIYGPTENSVISSSYLVEKEFENDISIGMPISNSTCYVIDKCEKLCPIGVPGDLYVGGDGLAFGYVNNQKLTDDKFVMHLGLNERVYKTGDLTLYYQDGNIKFMGRIDTQIKLRGQRIEISEIQNRILSYKGIKECVVLLKGDETNKFLVAYYVGKNISENEMNQFLKKYLPTYMVPSKLVQLEKMPLNQNGKIDRALLPDVKVKEIKKVKPKNKLEEKVLNAFKEVLGNESLGMIDDFFDNGGDSLSAMSLVGAMETRKIAITYSDIFNYSTAKSMCDFLNSYVKKSSDINSIKNYDYTNINKLLLSDTRTRNNKNIRNILLTGATGFLGIHILGELLENNDIEKIYCIVRNKNGKLAENRLIDKLHYYFGNIYDKILKEKVIIVEGNATHLELIDSKVLQEMKENVQAVINSAAYVKHFGKKEIFEQVNIHGVNKLIDFCKETNKRLIQISTISVSGNIIESGKTLISNVKEGTVFDETKLYVGQDIENVYVLSKFIAERNILESVINDNLDALIIRVGNLMGRYADGMFQKNISENAFINRIKTFANLGMIPENLKDIPLEFTPVDCTAKAIVKLLNNNNIIYHVYNKNHVSVEHVKEVLNDMGYSIIYVTKQDMTKTIKEIIKSSTKNNSLSGIVQDLNKDKEIDYSSNIKVASDKTVKELDKHNFSWPNIDKEYIETFLNYLKYKDFFKGE